MFVALNGAREAGGRRGEKRSGRRVWVGAWSEVGVGVGMENSYSGMGCRESNCGVAGTDGVGDGSERARGGAGVVVAERGGGGTWIPFMVSIVVVFVNL